MKVKTKKISYLFGLVAISLIVYWKWFFNFSILSSADWGFLYKETSREFFNLPFAWTSQSFGEVFLTISQYPYRLVLGLLSYFMDFSLSERILFLWPSLLLSLLSSYFLIKKICKSKIAALVGAIVYSYNTYFILGRNNSLALQVAFALSPLIFYFFIRTLEEKKIRLAIVTGLVSFICSAYEFRAFYIIAFVLFFYFIYYSIFIDQHSSRNFFKNSKFALFPIILVLLTNLYWILGLSQIGLITSNLIFNRPLFGNAFMNILRSTTLFHPFWTGTKIEYFVIQPILLYFFLIPIFSFLGLFLNKKNKNVLFFGFISLLGIFLAKQVDEPLPNAYQWLYSNFPGFNAFREASKFYFLIALGYSVLIGSFIDWVWSNWNKNRWHNVAKYSLTFLVAGLFLWNTKPVITGEIGTMFVSKQIPKDYLVLKDFILEQPEFFRTLYVPAASRWGIYANEKPKISNVAMIGSNWENLLESYNGSEKLIQDRIVNAFKLPFSSNLIDNSSIKYVVVPLQDSENDSDFFFYYGGEETPNIRHWYIDQLDTVSWLKKIDIGTEHLVIYENKDFRDHIYVTKDQESIYKNLEVKHVEYQFINPTEYKISLHNIKETTYLNFSEKYHPNWSLRLGKFNWFNVLINKNYFLDNVYHFENDSTLNSFLIDPAYIKQNFDKSYYKENPDGSIDFELTLYFRPQSYFYLGLIISCTTLLGCFIYLGYDFVNVRKNKK